MNNHFIKYLKRQTSSSFKLLFALKCTYLTGIHTTCFLVYIFKALPIPYLKNKLTFKTQGKISPSQKLSMYPVLRNMKV